MKKQRKIVLAYSGGLDTSIILKWLQENYDAEVIAYTADIGQKINKNKIINNAKKLGVKKIVIEASEQSNRISVPKIENLEPLKNFLNQFPKDGCLIFCDINCEKSNLKDILLKKIEGPVCILIGPEGDFSEKERQLIIEKKEIYSLSLATNILRAETAAIAAVTIVNYHLNFS